MINFDVIKENTKWHNPNWLHILDHLYRILTIRVSGSGKTNSSFNLASQLSGVDKICLYAKDTYKPKYQFLIDTQESTGAKHLNDSEAFVEHLNNVDNIYKNIEEYNPNKKCKILIVFDDLIANELSNKKSVIVTEVGS